MLQILVAFHFTVQFSKDLISLHVYIFDLLRCLLTSFAHFHRVIHFLIVEFERLCIYLVLTVLLNVCLESIIGF